MATFLAVHGAWHGGWAFEPLREGLAARGHRLIAPDLRGTGDEAALARTTLADWAEQVADAARAEPEPVILCGHSRGGVVISEAAERAPEAIAALVYIAAFLVPDGRCLADFAGARSAEFSAGLTLVAGGAAVAVAPAAAISVFYNRTAPELARAAAARLVPEPVRIRATALSLTEARYGSLPRHYIECADDRMIPVDTQRAMHRLAGVASVAMLDSDHSPFLSCPEALIEKLDDIAGLYAEA